MQHPRVVLDHYDTDPKRGFYGGGGIDARFGKSPMIRARRASRQAADGARAMRVRWHQFRALHGGRSHGTSIPIPTNMVTSIRR